MFFAEELEAQTKERFSIKKMNLCQVHFGLKISFIRYHIAIAFTRKDMAAMKREKHVGFRIENELHRKMVYIAEYEGRSLTWQMVHLMQDCVRQFEKEHGPIDIPPEQ